MLPGEYETRQPVVFELSTRWSSPAVVIDVRGEVDTLTAPFLGSTLGVVVAGGHRDVVLDLAATTFMDAAGAGVIAATSARLHKSGCAFSVRSPRGIVRRLLTLVELDGLVDVDVAGTPMAEREPERDDDHEPVLRLGALQARAVIAQAQGVIMARQGIPADMAFTVLRESATATGRPILQRAQEVVAGTLRDGLIGGLRA